LVYEWCQVTGGSTELPMIYRYVRNRYVNGDSDYASHLQEASPSIVSIGQRESGAPRLAEGTRSAIAWTCGSP
jgi:hypothetical protein